MVYEVDIVTQFEHVKRIVIMNRRIYHGLVHACGHISPNALLGVPPNAGVPKTFTRWAPYQL